MDTATRIRKNFDRNKRRAGIQMPAWADYTEIYAVYTKCQEYRQLGLDMVVDHIYPLNGVLVSGLHVHENLQIISGHQNLKKRKGE